MDPLTAIGLAASILQFIDFSAKLVNAARDIHHSATGASTENENIEFFVSGLNDLSSRLAFRGTGQLTKDEQNLCDLAERCKSLSDKILDRLKNIKPKDPKSKRQSVWSAIKVMWKEGEIKELERQLESCRNQLHFHLDFLTRSETKASLEILTQGSAEAQDRLRLIQENIARLRQGVTITSMSLEFQTELREFLGIASERIRRQQKILNLLKFNEMYSRFEDLQDAHKKTFEWIFDETYHDSKVDDAKPFDKANNDKRESLKLDGDMGVANNSFNAEDGNFESNDNDLKALTYRSKVEDHSSNSEDEDSEPPPYSLNDKEDSSKSEGDNNSTSDPWDFDETESKLKNNTRFKDIKHNYSAREPFLHWLSTGKDIFHISGKLGSGKSTLMKFLYNHERTRAELQKWAGERKLVLTKFFFWKHGSELQRSLGGLFRCLLHDVLCNCPELIPKVFPELWYPDSTAWTQVNIQLQNKQIREAFTQLIKHPKLYEKHCFCFFIDGLDEYEETTCEYYRDMIELLHEWTRAAPDNVKICVSSREDLVFLNSLAADRRLRLQDLTRGDMERYIRYQLRYFDDKLVSNLMDTILKNASGIFLWVVLVVKSLRERLEETQDLSVLEEEIDMLPDQLEGLFQHLLNTMSKFDRTRTYKAFSILRLLSSSCEEPPSLSLFAYAFLEDYTQNPKFAMQTPFQYESMSTETRKKREDQAQKTLRGSTKGLVEAVGGTVKYIHRSIPDFLESEEVQKGMAIYLQKFNTADAVSQLLVAELRAEAYMSNCLDREHCSLVVSNIIRIWKAFGLDRATYSFFESLGSVLTKHPGLDTPSCPAKGVGLTAYIMHTQSSLYFFDIRYPELEMSSEDFYIISPFHISASLGLEEYVIWKVRHDQSVLNDNFDLAILVSIVERGSFGSNAHMQILESLLERGLCPQTVMHSSPEETSSSEYNDLTVWENFVFMTTWRLADDMELDCKKRVGKVFQKFLEYGANPSLWLSATSSSIHELKRNGRKIVTRHPWLSDCDPAPILNKEGGISFREFVEYWDFENQESLLRLIDKNIREQEKQIKAERGLRELEVRLRQLKTWLESIKTSHILTFGLGLFVAIIVPRL